MVRKILVPIACIQNIEVHNLNLTGKWNAVLE